MLNSIDQAKRAHEATGGAWFLPETMAYWGTRLCTALVWPVSDGILFLTSNKPGFATERTYSVHFCHDSGKMDGLWSPPAPGRHSGDVVRCRTAQEAARYASALRDVWEVSEAGNITSQAAHKACAAVEAKTGTPS